MFEAEDWDMSTRVLSGLQPPAKGMTMYDRRYDGRYPDSQAQLLMKSVAVSLYNHQKMTEMFKPNVSPPSRQAPPYLGRQTDDA